MERFVLLTLIAIAISLALSAFGYATARKFVHDRLKFVDAAQTMKAPIIAGLVAWAIAMPLTFLLPFVGAGTAIVFGLSVGLGVRAGQKDIKFGRITGG
jgi:hypothetical protein